MSLYRRVIALCTCLLLLAAAFSALAEETDPVMTAEEAEAARYRGGGYCDGG